MSAADDQWNKERYFTGGLKLIDPWRGWYFQMMDIATIVEI